MDSSSMSSADSTPNGAIQLPDGGFIFDDDQAEQDYAENVDFSEQAMKGDFVGDETEDESIEKVTGKKSKQEKEKVKFVGEDEKEEKQKFEKYEKKIAYKSKTHGEVDEETIEKLLAYKDKDLSKIDELEKFRAEIQTAANKKFMAAKKEREAVMQEREQALSVLEHAKKNPMEFLSAVGVDINKIVRSQLEEDMRLAQMTPEQRQEYSKYKQVENEKAELAQRLQAYEQEMERYHQQKLHQQKEEKFTNLAKHISNLHKEAGLIDSPEMVRSVILEMQAAKELQEQTGVPISPSKLINSIKSRVYSDALKIVSSFKSFDDASAYDKDESFRNAMIRLATEHASKNRTLSRGQPQEEIRQRPAVESRTRREEPKFIGESELRKMKLRGEW